MTRTTARDLAARLAELLSRERAVVTKYRAPPWSLISAKSANRLVQLSKVKRPA